MLAAGHIPAVEYVAASGGNHGAAVAHVTRSLELPPKCSAVVQSRDEAATLATLGATVHVIEGLDDAQQAAATLHQAATGGRAVHPFEHADVIAGQGTMARELEQQVAGFDTVSSPPVAAASRPARRHGSPAANESSASSPKRASACMPLLAGEPVEVGVAGRLGPTRSARSASAQSHGASSSRSSRTPSR